MDLVIFGAFFHRQGLSSNVGHVGVFLAWYFGVYPELSSHIISSKRQHIPCYSYNLLSIQGNCDTPNLLKFHSAPLGDIEDYLHNLW